MATKIETKLTSEPLRKEIILDLVHVAGPCVTLLLPRYRPGEPSEPAAAILKTDLQEAAKKLVARRIPEPLIAELLEPLHKRSRDEELLAGSGSARVIFRSLGVLRQFELPVAPSPERACTVGECFWIRPILPSISLPTNVYVLEVTKKDVVLLACAMRGVQFGTGSGRETQHAHLHDFYRAVDRGLSETLRSNEPLVLAGVEVDVAIYRSISTYSNLLEQAIHGSPGDVFSQAQILRRAQDIALFDLQRRVALEMAESKERLAPARFSTDLESILRAALKGRVSDLYLDENGQRMGTFDGKDLGGPTNWHDEDLLNVGAVETLLRGGAVYSLPSHLMSGAIAAAAFRY